MERFREVCGSMYVFVKGGIMAASSKTVNAGTTNALNLHKAKPPIFSLCHGHATGRSYIQSLL